jgi:hypothetical protein
MRVIGLDVHRTFAGCVANVLFRSFSYSLLGFIEEGSMFKGRHFDRSVILLCVRWYLAYNLSLRNLDAQTAGEVSLQSATIACRADSPARRVSEYEPL